MFKGKFIKSAEGNDENENQFEIDETIVDEVSNAEEFADVDISNEDIMDAVEAIDALADSVIEKANVEEKKIDADELLDEVRDLIDSDSEPAEEEFPEEEELPEELTNSAVRVMVSEDGAVELEQTPDEVYDSDIDDVACTVFDTCDEYPVDVEDTAAPENTEDDVLVIGNSKAKSFKKGYVVLKSSANKKCWSAAVKKVKKMIGSKAKMTAAHWAIVSAIAKKEEEDEKLKKKIECKLIKILRSNKEFKKFLKSDAEFDPEGQPVNETKPEDTVGKENGVTDGGDVTNETSPEEVTSQSGNPTQDPETNVEHEDDVVLPEGETIALEVPLTNSKKRIQLKRVMSNSTKNFKVFKVINSSKEIETLDGKCIKCGKIGYVFKNTGAGLLACAARYVDNGKGTYKPVLKNNNVVITRGKETPVFQSAEKLEITKMVASARNQGRIDAKKEALLAARKGANPTRRPVTNAARRGVIARPNGNSPRRPITNARTPMNRPNPTRRPVMSAAERQAKLEAIKSRRNARQQVMSAKERENALRKQFDAEERQRLFQSSQKEMNQEKTVIKNNNSRNAETLSKLYKGMF